jgi:hypothetical protein
VGPQNIVHRMKGTVLTLLPGIELKRLPHSDMVCTEPNFMLPELRSVAPLDLCSETAEDAPKSAVSFSELRRQDLNSWQVLPP